MAILDQYGNPITPADIAEPQTARITALQHQLVESHLDGLTPGRAARILRDADLGDILAQHQLFDDVYDRDAHVRCEYDKRIGAVTGLDWSIVPPAGATSAEIAAAEWVEETLRNAVDDLEDCLGAMMEAPGHGFAAVEIEWLMIDGMRLPRFHPRPQTWFRTDMLRRELRLNDGSGDGAVPTPMGWVIHHAKKAKTGYLGRAGLFRSVLWPFLYKAYSIGDFAEFLEVYGLPFIVGKYQPGANAEEKASLLRAVASLGRDARAIMPEGMQIELMKVSAGGDGSHHLSMAEWADGAQSKAILGQVLSAETKATGMGSGVADLHGQVRADILEADARQMAGTLTRDLVYPLLALNRPGIRSLTRCPRWAFDTGSAEDLAVYADALPKLAQGGARIPVSWVHERLRIPMATEQEPVFSATPPIEPPPAAMTGRARRVAALAGGDARDEAVDDPVDAILAAALDDWREDMAPMVDPIQRALDEAVERGDTAESFLERLPELLERMDPDALLERMTRAAFAARLGSRGAE
jgi:phage gp29-like protein